MASARGKRRVFSLDQARELLPTVKRLTAEAVRDAETLAVRLRGVDEHDPEHEALTTELQQVVADWTRSMKDMSLEVKGLWLVDFDNGVGYYCWCYPEDGIDHFHGYTDGFAGRMRIM